MSDPYTLPGGTLRNLLGIQDRDALAQAEADIASAVATVLVSRQIPGSYDLTHLRRFHAALFGKIYDWAGELRTVEIAKGASAFCRVALIESYAADVFGRLAAEQWLRGRSQPAFTAGLVALYADLNALHPFREGNGRTGRAFLAQLARDAGWRLDWSGLGEDENAQASAKSFQGDDSLLEAMLAPRTSRL
jgi:cell filamentation protein